ncbi:hypothetical protein D3C84_1183540 [compost metagenome]
MLCIMILGLLPCHDRQLAADHLETFLFKPFYNLADKSPLYTIWLYHEKCFFHL